MSNYRPNVGIVVFNSNGEVLLGKRVDFVNAWQFPQGGIDENEPPLTAAQRELFEEVGINDGLFVYEYPEWLDYDYPPPVQEKFRNQGKRYYQGQSQKWFLFYWNQPASECNLEYEREFSEVKFVPIAEVFKTIPDFKKQVYQAIMGVFQAKITDYLRS